MAKIMLNKIVESAHGKIKGSCNVSYRQTYGCDHTYTWNKETKVRLTPLRHIQQEAMRLANIQARSIVADPAQKAVWQSRFEGQSRYRYFRPYLVAMLMAEIKSELKEKEERKKNQKRK